MIANAVAVSITYQYPDVIKMIHKHHFWKFRERKPFHSLQLVLITSIFLHDFKVQITPCLLRQAYRTEALPSTLSVITSPASCALIYHSSGLHTRSMSRSFSVIGPSLWNHLPRSAPASLLSSNRSTSLSLLKTCLFSWS